MRTDGQTNPRTDGHDETNSRFSQFCKTRLKDETVNNSMLQSRQSFQVFRAIFLTFLDADVNG